jgi:hypothetical protein
LKFRRLRRSRAASASILLEKYPSALFVVFLFLVG